MNYSVLKWRSRSKSKYVVVIRIDDDAFVLDD